MKDHIELPPLPARPEPNAPANTVGLEWDAYSGFQMLSYGQKCALTAIEYGEPVELQGVADTIAEGDGSWRSCTGCNELNEGHDTGPYSEALKCHLGNGCSECGGIGAVWDTTNYQAMADAMAAPVAARPGKASDHEKLMTAQAREAANREWGEKYRDRADKWMGDFKNFHRMLCERFGYSHDEQDWYRDQVSLMEHIAAQPSVPDGLIAALRNQRQIDKDGSEVAVSRQAVDEAADLLDKLATPSADVQAQQDAGKVDALLAAGAALSNAAFNLAQQEGEMLTADWCLSLTSARKAWDAARAQQSRGDHGR